MKTMDMNLDVGAAFSAGLGFLLGGLGMAFRWGKQDGVVVQKLESNKQALEDKIDNLQRIVTLVTDELARRITVLENRVQYDGFYTMPRIKRHDPNSTSD